MNSNFKAIIAAGGTRSRLGLNHPKSGLTVSGHSLAYWTALSLYKAGIREIYVYVNNKSWAFRFEQELDSIPGCYVVVDKGYDNTFLLFKDLCKQGNKYIFTYGHTPRPSNFYKKLLHLAKPLVISYVDISTKRQPIIVSREGYIEPPYVIDTNFVDIEMPATWVDFFTDNKYSKYKFSKLHVREFNYPDEWNNYKSYLESEKFISLFNEANKFVPIFHVTA